MYCTYMCTLMLGSFCWNVLHTYMYMYCTCIRNDDLFASHSYNYVFYSIQGNQQSLNDLVTDPSISPAFRHHPSQGEPPPPILSALCVTGSAHSTEPFSLHQLVLPDTIPITIHKEGLSQLTKKVHTVYNFTFTLQKN